MAGGKSRLRFSKLYTWAGCFKPPTQLDRQQSMSVGGPGFSRVVFCNDQEKHLQKPYRYKSNYVSTTKYNALTFLPKALFEQFRRVANIYFLFAAALSLTSVSPYSSSSLIAPLVFVVGVSMCKEALEDWRRFLQVSCHACCAHSAISHKKLEFEQPTSKRSSCLWIYTSTCCQYPK